MTERYYKAVRPDGFDFYSQTVDYGAALASGETLVHPSRTETQSSDAARYFSVATAPTDCTGMRWPCRLLVVEPVGDVWTPSPDLPNKRACTALRVVEERPAHEALGPQGAQLADLIGQAARLTEPRANDLAAARDAAWAAAGDAARDAAWAAAGDAARDARDVARAAAGDAARDAAWAAAGDAAGDAARAAAWAAAWDARDVAWALTVRDLIGADFTQEHYDLLTGPWRTVVGRIHPDDADLMGGAS